MVSFAAISLGGSKSVAEFAPVLSKGQESPINIMSDYRRRDWTPKVADGMRVLITGAGGRLGARSRAQPQPLSFDRQSASKAASKPATR